MSCIVPYNYEPGRCDERQTVGVFRIISVKDVRELLMLVEKKEREKKARLISKLKYHSCWYNLPSAAIALAYPHQSHISYRKRWTDI